MVPLLLTLENGPTVLVLSEPDAKNLAIHLLYPAGASYDPPGKSGLAHLVEHARFYGSAAGFDTALGALGGSSNAWTNQDFAAFYEEVPAENGKAALDLELKRLREWQAPLKVEGLKRTIHAEEGWRGVYPYLRRLWPEGHPYHRAVLGTDLEHLGELDVQEFADAYYRPDRAILTLAGRISPDLETFLSQPTAALPPMTPLGAPAVRPIRVEQTRLWPYPPSSDLLGIEVLTKMLEIEGFTVDNWVGRRGGYLQTDGPLHLRWRWLESAKKLEQLTLIPDSLMARAQTGSLCWALLGDPDCAHTQEASLASLQKRRIWAAYQTLRGHPRLAPPSAPPPPAPAPGPETDIRENLADGSRLRMIQRPGSRKVFAQLSVLIPPKERQLPDEAFSQLLDLGSLTHRGLRWRQAMAAAGATVDGHCEDLRCAVTVESLPEGLPAALSLLREWLETPQTGDLDTSGEDAQERAVASLIGRPWIEAELAMKSVVSREFLRLQRAPRLWVIAGDLDPAPIRTLLSSWPSTEIFASLPPPADAARSSSQTTLSFPDLLVTLEALPPSPVAVTLLYPAPWPSDPQRAAWNQLFRRIAGASWSLAEGLLREQSGFTYAISVRNRYGENGAFAQVDFEVRSTDLRRFSNFLPLFQQPPQDPNGAAVATLKMERQRDEATLQGVVDLRTEEEIFGVPPSSSPAFSPLSPPLVILAGVAHQLPFKTP